MRRRRARVRRRARRRRGVRAGRVATNECHGIPSCIRVPGPWVVVPAHGTATYLLTCPNGRSVVGGLDAQATSRDVRVSFDGRLGAPVQPGQTTTRYAFFRAVSVSGRTQAFQPLLGCIPTQGGGGRSTVSARVVPVGQPLEFRSRIVVVGPGDVKFARVACLRDRDARRRAGMRSRSGRSSRRTSRTSGSCRRVTRSSASRWS